MKRRTALGMIMASGCSKPPVLLDRGIPRSERSRAAVARVRPGIEAKLREIGRRWGDPVYLRIFKAEKELECWVADAEGHCALQGLYPVCGMSGEPGPKLREGDRQAPEGCYGIRPAALNPASSYHLAMNIGYPNEYDRGRGRTGSLIMIHGDCASIGCFAMTDEGIEPLYALVEAALEAGQSEAPVHIFPFRPGHPEPPPPPHAEAGELWRELEPIHRDFERARRIPRVVVRDGGYRRIADG